MASFNRKMTKTIGSTGSFGKGLQSLPAMKGLDFKIYENPKSDCSQSPDHIPITERCSALKRLCTASLYFDAMNSSKLEDAMKKSLWIEFNEEVYQNVVEDTIHLVQKHDGDIKRIQREWTERYGVPKCNVAECTKTARHYSRGRREIKKEESNGGDDALYTFHQSLHDRVHHFLFHLYDIGMRVDMSSMAEVAEDEEEKETNSKGVTVDKSFATERDQIKQQKEDSKLDMDRFDGSNNKYSIQMASEKKGGMTLMDALFRKLYEKIKTQQETLHRVRDYFVENAFDSECIEMDIEDVVDSNISNIVQNQAAVEIMADFIRSVNCMLTVLLRHNGA